MPLQQTHKTIHTHNQVSFAGWCHVQKQLVLCCHCMQLYIGQEILLPILASDMQKLVTTSFPVPVELVHKREA